MTDLRSPFLDELLDRCHFPSPGTDVCCAVSGGPDSMAMMILAHSHGLRVRAVHVDHGLRPTSAHDADVVRRVAEPLGIELEIQRVQVEPGSNLEARAREARYQVLPAGALIGHTADDQAETILINLLRGSGAAGLAGMRSDLSRPILSLRRHDTHSICTRLGIAVVSDETNDDPRFQRNRIRREVMPLLQSVSGRDPVPLLLRTADLLRSDDELLEELSRQIDPTDARTLALAPAPLARRAIRRWLAQPYPPDAATIERVLAVARGEATACEIGGNREVRRSKQQLHVRQVR